MRVYRGRAGTVEADRAATDRLVERAASGGEAAGSDCDEPDATAGEPAVRVWTPHRQVAFGRRDSTADGYQRARAAASERGFPPVEREVGGRAVAYAGSTVAFVRATPVADPRSGLHERYDATVAALRSALDALGVDASAGEPPDSFCPGRHSLQIGGPGGDRPGPEGRQTGPESRQTGSESRRTGPDNQRPGREDQSTVADGRARKIAGIAQRVRRDVAVVAGVLLVRDHEAVADVLDPVYAALDVPFDPTTVGSVALAGGEADPDAVVAAVEDALVGSAPAQVQRVPEST